MTELSIRPDDIRAAIERNVASFAPATTREEVGRVTVTGDGLEVDIGREGIAGVIREMVAPRRMEAAE